MTGFHHRQKRTHTQHTYTYGGPGSYVGPDNAKVPTPLSSAPNPLGMVPLELCASHMHAIDLHPISRAHVFGEKIGDSSRWTGLGGPLPRCPHPPSRPPTANTQHWTPFLWCNSLVLACSLRRRFCTPCVPIEFKIRRFFYSSFGLKFLYGETQWLGTRLPAQVKRRRCGSSFSRHLQFKVDLHNYIYSLTLSIGINDTLLTINHLV